MEKAVLIGSDIPDLSSSAIDAAFELLDASDVVLGDSGDGGYYLIGTRAPYPFLFQNIQYSTTSVYEATCQVW